MDQNPNELSSPDDVGSAGPQPAVTIEKIELRKLFGLYSYDVTNKDGVLGPTPILYGENGLGKTNILRAVFHLLSPADDRRHRMLLGKIKFESITVHLSNAIEVNATRTLPSLLGATRFEVNRKTTSSKKLLGAWDWFPDESRKGGEAATSQFLQHLSPTEVKKLVSASSATKSKATSELFQSFFIDYVRKESNPIENKQAFLSALQKYCPPIYFLTADRILISDQVEQDSPIPVLEGRLRPEEMISKGRERSLRDAIYAASRYLSQVTFRATRRGSQSVRSIYQDLLKRLTSAAPRGRSKPQKSISEIRELLLKLSADYDRYATYAIAPPLQGGELVKHLDAINTSQQRAAVGKVMRPYVASLIEQSKSLEKAYQTIETIVSTVNAFLYDKTVSFMAGSLLEIKNRLGEKLEPSELSSGEQQLLLLFCHITLAHDSGGIFIIDEPEISLNIKWQRMLIDALTRLDQAKNLQFLLASHSIELLAKHKDNVISLEQVEPQ